MVDLTRLGGKMSPYNYPFMRLISIEDVFPIQLTLPMAKFLQEEQDEGNDMERKMNDLVEV